MEPGKRGARELRAATDIPHAALRTAIPRRQTVTPPTSVADIVAVHSEAEVAMVRALFLEYAETLGVDLCFQGFDHEVASLPGDYAPPAGALFLATSHTLPVGCVGIRALTGTEAELQRLYVRPEARGT